MFDEGNQEINNIQSLTVYHRVSLYKNVCILKKSYYNFVNIGFG